MSVKINSLQAENVKRIRAVKLEPTANGLTIIGGRNNQGKTSVLDSIAWALGGNKFRPSQPARDGSVIPPKLHLELSNGLIVERAGKNGSLKVVDPNGQKAGQQLLDEFVEYLALDLPRFMEASTKEKADILLKIIGIGDQLIEMSTKESQLYNRRLEIGRIADQKAKHAKELPFYSDAPAELISPSDLIREQQEILARNGENQRKRMHAEKLEHQAAAFQTQVDDLTSRLSAAKAQLAEAMRDLEIARMSAEDLQDESTEELEQNIRDIEAINTKVRSNLNKEHAEDEAAEYRKQYDTLTSEIEKLREDRRALLNGADMPLPGLSVEDGALIYQGQQWDNMSGSDQLRVATAIVRRLNPECGFVLLDKLEQMDLDTLREFGAWLESEGLQAIATRVSTGDECSIIIEDGYVQGMEIPKAEPLRKTWKKGEF